MSGIKFKTDDRHPSDVREDSGLLLRPGMGTLSYGPRAPGMATWEALQSHVSNRMSSLRSALTTDGALSVGLQISSQLVDALAEPGRRRQLMRLLEEARLWAVGADGSQLARGRVALGRGVTYDPDWREEDRLHYTTGLAELLAEIAPEGRTLTVSTAPGAPRELATSREAVDDIADGMLRAAAYLCDLERRTGRRVALAIEPAPFGLLETTGEAAAFFEAQLLSPRAERRFASLADVPKTDASDLLRRFLGICYDTAHAAIMDEDPAGSLACLRKAGVPVHRLQLSVCPAVWTADDAAMEALRSCDIHHEPVAAAGLDDRGEALRIPDFGAWMDREEAHAGRAAQLKVLLRLPISAGKLGALPTSRTFVAEVLAEHRARPITRDIRIVGGDREKVPASIWPMSEEATAQADIDWVRGRLP